MYDCTSFVEAIFTRKAESDLRQLRLPVRVRVKQLFAWGRELDWSAGGTVGQIGYQGAVSTRIPYASADVAVLNPFASLKGKCLGVIDNNLPVYEALKGVPEYMESLGMQAELALNFHSYKNGKSFTVKDGKPVLEVELPVSSKTDLSSWSGTGGIPIDGRGQTVGDGRGAPALPTPGMDGSRSRPGRPR